MNTRRPRAAFGILAVVMLLLVVVTPAFALRKSSGPGCAANPDDVINNAEAGDIFTPLYEEDFGRNTNGATIAVNFEIEGGWSSPGSDCGGSSTGEFNTPEEMLAAGLTFNPANRSELRGFDPRVLTVASGVRSLKIRNIILGLGSSLTGRGGGLFFTSQISTTFEFTNLLVRPLTNGDGVSQEGGGMFLDVDGGSRIFIRNSEFRSNSALAGGGLEVRLRGGSRLLVSDSIFADNSAGTTGGGLRIWLYDGVAVINRNQFLNNSATQGGGAIRIVRPAGSTGQAVVYLVGNSFSGNSSNLSIDPGITVYDEQIFLPLLTR